MEDGDFVRDISAPDFSKQLGLENPHSKEACAAMKKRTIARICVGRAGCRLRTETYLRLRADHAVAMDTIWSDVDDPVVDSLGFYKIKTLVRDKEEYLTRPDLGRIFSKETLAQVKADCMARPDVEIIVADGLSAHAINDNLADVYPALCDGLLDRGLHIGTPIFVKYGRVATMDPLSEVLCAKVTVLLVGERPGLAVGSSMGCYMAYEASGKKPESQRTVVSNIHKNGTPPVEAGAQIADLAALMLRERKSGLDLKIR